LAIAMALRCLSLAGTNAKGNIYVADRANRRIQVFDGKGTLLNQIKFNVPVPPNARRQAQSRGP
jgi:sugar lactone lactonase YvrE